MDDVFLFTLAVLIVVGGIFATIASARLMLDMADELDAGRQTHEAISTLMATAGSLRIELYRFFTDVIFAGVGLISLFASFVPLPTWVRGVSRLLLVTAVVLVYLQSLKAARTRREAIAQLRAEQREEQEGG